MPVGQRHAPPPEPVRAALVRLLAGGLVLGFASGRGRSLHRELRAWVPRGLWDRVLVGMYTGGARVWLAEEVSHVEEIRRPDLSPAAVAGLAEAHARLAAPPFDRLFVLARPPAPGQVSVKPRPDRPVPVRSLIALSTAVLGRPPALPVRLAASAYAIDIVPATVSKAAVAAEVAAAAAFGSAVLAVGDRGEPGGNDFELLACVPYSLQRRDARINVVVEEETHLSLRRRPDPAALPPRPRRSTPGPQRESR